MTQKEKQLLFNDLCARLPYGVKILDIPANVVGYLFLVSKTDTVEYEPADETNDDDTWRQTLYNIKPYLRPMSSMTEEEYRDFAMLQTNFYSDGWLYPIAAANMVNWLNAHHFDYRGLIPMGLALEAPEDMYKTKQ